MRFLALAAMLALSVQLPACPAAAEPPVPERTVWQGEVEINESLFIPAGRTLVILPGTTVRIRTVAPSCTEGSAPVITVAGDLSADGTADARIRFVSVTSDGAVCTEGREAMLVYAGTTARNQSLSFCDFTGGALLCYQAALPIRGCTFNRTSVRFSGDNSTVRGCAFLDSPLSVFPRSATVIEGNTFTRSERDESGIYLYDSASVRNNTISNCVSGIEASIWITGAVAGNTITGCLEAVNSTGALDITQNSFTGNGIGLRSWAGLDRLEGNLIGGNDIGISSLGRLAGRGNNTFRTQSGAQNRLSDIQEMLLASGVCEDGNGQPLGARVTIQDVSGRTVFSGDPDFVALIAYERLPDGSERRFAPFTARASMLGASNSTVLDGTYNVSFRLRLELYPELVLHSFRGGLSGAEPGAQVPFTITVRNTGLVAARNFRVAAFVDGEQAYMQHVNSLGPGDSRNLTFIWQASGGTHSFRAEADTGQAVAEPSEKDNTRTFRAQIRVREFVPGPPMLVGSLIVLAAGAAIISARRRGA